MSESSSFHGGVARRSRDKFSGVAALIVVPYAVVIAIITIVHEVYERRRELKRHRGTDMPKGISTIGRGRQLLMMITLSLILLMNVNWVVADLNIGNFNSTANSSPSNDHVWTGTAAVDIVEIDIDENIRDWTGTAAAVNIEAGISEIGRDWTGRDINSGIDSGSNDPVRNENAAAFDTEAGMGENRGDSRVTATTAGIGENSGACGREKWLYYNLPKIIIGITGQAMFSLLGLLAFTESRFSIEIKVLAVFLAIGFIGSLISMSISEGKLRAALAKLGAICAGCAVIGSMAMLLNPHKTWVWVISGVLIILSAIAVILS